MKCPADRSRSTVSPGSPSSLLHAVRHEDPGQAGDLFVAEDLVALEEGVVRPEDFFRHAVGTTEVAAVGYRYAEIAQRALEGVEEGHTGSLAGSGSKCSREHNGAEERTAGLATPWILNGPPGTSQMLRSLAAGRSGEGPDIELGQRDAEARQSGADLAAVIGAVVDDLREADAHR